MKIKRMISLLLNLALVLGVLSGCGVGTNPANTDEVPKQSSMQEQGETIPDDEYEQAIWYGFSEAQEDADAVTTEIAFVDMLSAMIQVYDPDSLTAFEEISFVKEANQSQIPRFYAAILLLYAAEAMECVALPNGTYPTLNTDTTNWEAFWTTDWSLTDGLSEDTFAENSAAMTAAWGEPMNHYHGGINFAASRLSLVSAKPLLDVDNENYMRQNDYLTHREAATAVVRLFESNSEAMEFFPEDGAAAAVAEEVLAKAEERRQAILNSPTQVTYTGTAYYVSNNGNDKNDGRSPENAWASISRVNQEKLNVGDAVFFERGGTWRAETLETKKGVTYSAYGEGAKPRLIGSPENGAGEEKWTLLEGTDNIWVYYKDMLDCGLLVLNDNITAEKVLGFWNGQEYLEYTLEYAGANQTAEEILSAPVFDVKTQLSEDLTFFSHASSELPDTLPVYLDGPMSHYDDMPLTCKTKGKLYLRCDAGNPGKIYESIEFVTPMYAIKDPAEADTTFDNLFIGYTGIGLSVGNEGTTLQNCELAWIGSRVVSYSFEDHPGQLRGAHRVGGGLSAHASKMTIRNNYIHEMYEEAGLVESSADPESNMSNIKDFAIENVNMSGNLIYHTGSGIGYYNWDMERDPKHMYKNFVYEDNMILFTGLNDWLSKHISCAFGIDGGPNLQEGIVVRNNVFFASRDCLFYLNQYHKDTIADYEGNQYIQYSGYPYLLLNEEQRRYFADEAEYAVRELLGDQTGTITTLYSTKWDNLNW